MRYRFMYMPSVQHVCSKLFLFNFDFVQKEFYTFGSLFIAVENSYNSTVEAKSVKIGITTLVGTHVFEELELTLENQMT